MNIRQVLELANDGKVEPAQLYGFFSTHVPSIYVLYHQTESGKKPVLSKSNHPDGKYAVAFTDVEAAKLVKVEYPEYLQLVKEPTLPFLLKAFRSDAEGILLNPALPSKLFLVKHHLINLIREYCIHKLAHMSGAWIPTQDANMLLGEYQKGQFTVAIYVSEKEAKRVIRKKKWDGIQAVQHSWSNIIDRMRQQQASTLFLQFELPEQMVLQPEHIDRIVQGPQMGYQEPEISVIPLTEEKLASAVSEPQLVVNPVSVPPVVEKPGIEVVEKPTPEPIAQEAPSQEEETVQPRMDTIPMMDAITPEAEKKSGKEQTKQLVQEIPAKEENPVMEPQLVEPVQPEPVQKQVEVSPEPVVSLPPQQEDSPASKVAEEVQLESEQKPKESSSAVQPTESVELNEAPKTPPAMEFPVNPSLNRPNPSPAPTPSTEEVLASSPSARDPHIVQQLTALEHATIEDQGIGMGWGVCDALAKVRRIWVVMDIHNNMVILAGQRELPIIDLFSSMENAQFVIEKTRERNPNLPQMRPQLVSTKKLFRSLARKESIVWINRESSDAWRSPKVDTIPYVLQLMKQYGFVN
ncbi:brain acid soluble protein 1 [Risungbinella massiliensis]|uniref:brain acid soluble protein 1 n=1 Tax=Risungbinella massiliensis TaxID=1329796 RepID=UPI0005CB95F4|nr:brain acid soluble protein 1 [Risungbinella massiliensis]